MMTPFELVNLSMTSSRAKRSVTIFSKIKSRFQITLDLFTDDSSFNIKGNKRDWTYGWLPRRRCRTKDVISGSTYIYKMTENPREDCMEWYGRMNGVLGRRINRAYVWSLNKSVTGWLQLQQESFEDFLIFYSYHQDINYFLKKIKVFGSLNLFMYEKNNQSRLEIPDEPFHLSIRDAHFIEYEQFMRLKHQEIVIYGSSLTYEDINKFLISWMLCESHLGLKSLIITISGPETMTLRIEPPYQWTTDPNILRQFAGSPFNVNVTKGVNIQRCDGKIATICAERIWNRWNICLLVH
uniref:FBA_2 domain-containing protein n=1 Tax=Caenorhabditis tropicalis TaxID=1561998 RepID=A0A1I7TUL2_9PELO